MGNRKGRDGTGRERAWWEGKEKDVNERDGNGKDVNGRDGKERKVKGREVNTTRKLARFYHHISENCKIMALELKNRKK